MQGIKVPVGTVSEVDGRPRIKTVDGWKWVKRHEFRKDLIARGEKIRCPQCHRLKDATQFYKSGGVFKSWCKSCVKKKSREWAKKNVKRVKARAAAYRDTHREEYRKYALEYARAHPVKMCRAAKQWAIEHPERLLELRKAMTARRGGGHVKADDIRRLVKANIKRYGRLTCIYCEKAIKGVWELDHKVPISRGGKGTLRNLAVSCPRCNHKKWRMTAKEFMSHA